jgi:hypothetical protein
MDSVSASKPVVRMPIPIPAEEPEFVHSGRRLFLIPGFFLLLALLVFLSGTSYKLSLYRSPSRQDEAPVKLCTRASDLAKITLQKAVSRPAIENDEQLVHVLITVELTPESGISARRPDVEPQLGSVPIAGSLQHAFRPPPGLFRIDV